MTLLTFQVFLLVLTSMVTVVLTTVGLSAFYGCKIYLLFKNDKESKEEKKKKKRQSPKK